MIAGTMGSTFAEIWAAFVANPWYFVIAFAIGLPLIFWKWRTIGSSTRHAIDSQTHGLRQNADRKTAPHETGIGIREVLVMRPEKTPKAIYFALFFFGGGAVFYLLVVLQSGDVEAKDWWTFAALSGFAIGAMIVIELNMTRIIVSETTIQKRRVLHRPQTINKSDIARIAPLGANLTRGAILHCSDGQTMRIGANFSGYKNLVLELKGRENA